MVNYFTGQGWGWGSCVWRRAYGVGSVYYIAKVSMCNREWIWLDGEGE